MILLTALLFAAFAAGIFWIVMRHYENKQAITGRISKLSGAAPSPAAVDRIIPGLKKKDSEIGSAAKTDPMARDLFLAGIRSQQQIRFYYFLLKLSVIIPAILIAIYAVTGNLNTQNAFRIGCIGLAIVVVTRFSVKLAITKRKKGIIRELPQFLDLLVICMEAGLNFTAGLDRMLKEVDPNESLTKEFSVMYQEFLGGFSLQQVCERLDKRCDVPDLSVILNAVVQSEQMGSSLGSTLRIQAEELRDKFRQRMREKAYRIPIKILFPTILIFFTIFMMTLGPTFYQINKVMTKVH